MKQVDKPIYRKSKNSRIDIWYKKRKIKQKGCEKEGQAGGGKEERK